MVKRETIRRRRTNKPQPGLQRLTEKQKRYIALRVENPRKSKTSIAMQVFNTDKATNAGAIANQLEKKTHIKMALAAHSDLAEQTIIKSIVDYSDSDKQWQRTLAVETSKWVHDKLHGKAVQKNVNLNRDFTDHASDKAKVYNL